MTGSRSGDRNKVGGDRAILDRGYGYLRRGDRYTLDRWLGPQGGGGGVIPPISHDGDPVTLWPNLAQAVVGHMGASSLDLIGTGTTAPIYKEKIVNGHPVVRFTSAAGSILSFANPDTNYLPSDLPWSIFAVMRPVPGHSLLGFVDQPAGAPFTPGLDATADIFYAWDQAYLYQITVPAMVDGNFHYFSALSGPYELAFDGTTIAHTFQSSVNPNNYTSVGGGSDGDIAALFYYRANIAATDRANLRAYIGNKYGIAVANPGTPVSPDSIPNLFAWYEADTIFP